MQTEKNLANSGRIVAFDLGRGIAVFFMIVIHVLTFYGSPEVQEGKFSRVVDILLGWPSASVFVFLMGVFLGLSRKVDVAVGIKRGAMLFGLAYLLNLCRETIPTLISLKAGFVTYEQLGPYTPTNAFLVVDILQFAGIAYIVCVLCRAYLASPICWAIAALLVAFASPFLWDLQTGHAVLDYFLGIFVAGKEQAVLFPVMPWLAYPLVGMAYGAICRVSQNRARFFQKSLTFGAAIAVLGLIITLSNPDYHLHDNLRHGPGLIVVFSGLVLVWLWMWNALANRFQWIAEFSLFQFWSKNVTGIYIIHWLFVGWGLMLFGSQKLSLGQTLLLMLSVTVLSDLVMRGVTKIIQRPKSKKIHSKTACANAGSS